LELGRSRGLDTSEAYQELGLPQDPREYSRVNAILKHFGLSSIRLLTNNPRKIEGILAAGIDVARCPLAIAPTEASRAYLLTKQLKMGHLTDFPFDLHGQE
jgi:GTP cyclohydrolase II